MFSCQRRSVSQHSGSNGMQCCSRKKLQGSNTSSLGSMAPVCDTPAEGFKVVSKLYVEGNFATIAAKCREDPDCREFSPEGWILRVTKSGPGEAGCTYRKIQDPKLDTTCENKGVFTNGICVCPAGFTGDRCQQSSAAVLKNSAVIDGRVYALLDDAPLNGAIGSQEGLLPLPVGWELVPDAEGKMVSQFASWSTNMVATKSGYWFTTKSSPYPNWSAGQHHISRDFIKGTGADSGKYGIDRSYAANWGSLAVRILIRKQA